MEKDKCTLKEDRAMSKEREAFELFDFTELNQSLPKSPHMDDFRYQGWQACEAHYQPLLEAKDAEIARLVSCNEALMIERTNYIETARGHYARFEKENTTIKALLAEEEAESAKWKENAARETGFWVTARVENDRLKALLKQAREGKDSAYQKGRDDERQSWLKMKADGFISYVNLRGNSA